MRLFCLLCGLGGLLCVAYLVFFGGPLTKQGAGLTRLVIGGLISLSLFLRGLRRNDDTDPAEKSVE